MKAGFLVMSALIEENEKKQYILLPKHHNLRSVLFFEDLHISKTVKRLLGNYELKADKDFNTIVKNCVQKHGDDWLTPPLLEVISKIRENSNSLVRPFSFALYREGKLKAGEFGIIAGNVYTSYSGYYDEDSAGRVQMILAAQYLRDNGFSFWDLGMPLEYKYSLGVRDLDTKKFIQKFRQSV
jgi:Leu/Phe-tRNA-protein transferase